MPQLVACLEGPAVAGHPGADGHLVVTSLRHGFRVQHAVGRAALGFGVREAGAERGEFGGSGGRLAA
jgi:hypothetical protein